MAAPGETGAFATTPHMHSMVRAERSCSLSLSVITVHCTDWALLAVGA